MNMLFGVESYFRVEIEELTELCMQRVNEVYITQNQGWAWDKLAFNEYCPKIEYCGNPLTFLNGNRTVI